MTRAFSRFATAALVAFTAIALAMVSAVVAPPAGAVTALVAPGTGTPDANVVTGYLDNARDYYMTATPCTSANDCDVTGINYPASFWPLFFRPRWCEPDRCEKWDVSVADGLNSFNGALTNLLATDPDEEIVLFGYSQGGAVVSNQLRLLQDLDPALKERLSVVLTGNIDNPVGGLWSLLGFLGHIPIMDITTGLATIVDTGIPMTSVHFEYDGVGDSPIYWGNLPAVLNAAAGFTYVHQQMLWPNGYNETGLPNGYTPEELADQMDPTLHPENFTYDSYGNPFITIPTRTLPIMIPFLQFGQATGLSWFIEPLVDLVSPALRVIIDTAYDRTSNPGIPRYLSPLPFNPKLNPFEVAEDFVNAIGEGVQSFLGHFGPATAPAPEAVAPVGAALSPIRQGPAGSTEPEPVRGRTTPTPVPSAAEVLEYTGTAAVAAGGDTTRRAPRRSADRAAADPSDSGSRTAPDRRAAA